ncbi:MAG: lysophospholipid acyltransferase family protein [Candidatus Omnitrophica bacterium]|nr:lysophospholipid acyltransferase family protein [Candidatus Omnitrophota bacterium]MDD5670300.1 lysophospholipid acyltransferase family protein [Candidatus Omnitrophota bacterium]
MAKRKPYRIILYFFFRFVAGLLYLLPRPVLMKLAGGLGEFAYHIVARQREKALDNLRKAFSREKTEHEIRELAKSMFKHIGFTAAEVLQFPKLDAKRIEELVEATEAVRVYNELLSEGKGLISITAHIGNFELLAGVFGVKGYHGAVLARRIYYERYNRWIVGLRSGMNVRTIYRDRASREILDLLSRNEIIGLLPDQDIDSLKGVFVNFFGRPAYTPVAPIRLALASGAPILVNFLIRKPGGRYQLVIGEVIRPVVETTRDETVQICTEKWMACFERVIRQYPEQWAWMHDRWKTQPEQKSESVLDSEKHGSLISG